jgi:hypothetical protein
MPVQKWNAFKIQRIAKYIAQFGWKSDTNTKIECIHTSKNPIHLSCLMEVVYRIRGCMHATINEFLNTYRIVGGGPPPVQRFNAFTNQRIPMYIYQFGWSPTSVRRLNAFKTKESLNTSFIVDVMHISDQRLKACKKQIIHLSFSTEVPMQAQRVHAFRNQQTC